MSIGISEEHAELASSLRGWAAAAGGPAAARAWEGQADATYGDAWKGSVEMGLPLIAVPEPHGGGGTLLDQAVALEACAAELVVGPLLGPAVAAVLLARAGRTAGLEALAAGAVVSVALPGADGLVAWDAPSVDQVVCPVDGGWRLLPRAAVGLTAAPGLDLSRRHGRATVLDPGAGEPLPGVDTDLVRRVAVSLAAAEAAGIARWCLATATAYAKVREQFGRPIGSFQAVKHLCAEVLETAEAVTAAAWDAAAAADVPEDDRDDAQDAAEQWAFACDVAEVTCFDGAVEAAKTCIQVLGGIGFTFEHDAHLFLRRALSLRSALARPDAAAERLAVRAAAGVRRRVAVDLEGRDAAVREAVRADVARVAGAPAEQRRAALVDTGLLTPHWPAPYGRGADAVEQVVIDEELAAAGVERPDLVIAGWALPTIIQHGTEAQRERFVDPSLRGELVWCQLFSEPGSGSDLASLRTRAERVEGGWRLTGQKVWTSVADRADWAICLARTDPDVPQHRGITYFLVDMRSAGIDVRPLREITGEALFNEVFLDDVLVPDECVVAEPGDGWRLARTTLANERVAMASTRLSAATERAVALAADLDLPPARRVEVGRAVALSTVCTLLGVRSTLRSLAGQGPGAESSVAKLLGVRNRQDAAELVVRLQEDRLLLVDTTARHDDRFAADVWEMLNTRCLSIAGGTTQVLRNVAGERILGLPR